eukprot:6198629-Pleurochrysis_carterae.AAC.1
MRNVRSTHRCQRKLTVHATVISHKGNGETKSNENRITSKVRRSDAICARGGHAGHESECCPPEGARPSHIEREYGEH